MNASHALIIVSLKICIEHYQRRKAVKWDGGLIDMKKERKELMKRILAAEEEASTEYIQSKYISKNKDLNWLKFFYFSFYQEL